MALTITHLKVSAIPDDPLHPEEVRPSDWNAGHVISGTVDASEITSPAALTASNDTNVTLTLGGAPTTSLLSAASVTAGWSGTLAAGRLNTNVVQAVTNDTNVTGSVAAQTLTLGWTGTLAAARLNANVPQAVTNDTNVTGSIAAQNLTLGWTGQLSAARGGTGLSSLGSGVATFLGTPSSANLAAAITDETGSGAAVFATSPALVTPALGVATATSMNKVAITAPATSATLAIGDGFTLTYDEGSWTPVLAGATTAGTQTYSTQVGRYIRVGNSINLWCRIVLTALDAASAGGAQITGLPFTSSTVTGLNFPGFVGPAALISHAAGYTQFVAQVSGSSTTISLQEIGDNISNASVPITNFHNTSTIQIAITYRTG